MLPLTRNNSFNFSRESTIVPSGTLRGIKINSSNTGESLLNHDNAMHVLTVYPKYFEELDQFSKKLASTLKLARDSYITGTDLTHIPELHLKEADVAPETRRRHCHIVAPNQDALETTVRKLQEQNILDTLPELNAFFDAIRSQKAQKP